MNLGGFGIGFSQGFNNGVNIGRTINDARKQAAIEDVRAKGMEEAKASRENAITGMIKDNGIGAPASAPAPQPNEPKTGDTVPETPDVYTRAVPTPPPAVPSPQAAVDAAPAKPMPMAAVDMPDATGATRAPASTTPASLAAGGIGASAATPALKRYSVGGTSFDSLDEARAHAEKTAPSVADLFLKHTSPKISAAYLEQGDVDKAEAWDNYAKQKASQKNIENWASAYKAYASGDFVGAAKGLVAMHGDLPDGNTIVAADPVKDNDGNVTGFNMKVKNDATGETRAQFVDPKTLTEAGLQALSPQAMFESVYKRQQMVDAARIANAAKAADEQRKLQGQIVVEGVKAGYASKADERKATREDARDQRRLDREDQRDQNRADREAENIRLKADLENKFKKTTDPQERRAMIVTELSKNPMYANKSQDDINAAADKWMGAMQAGQNLKPSTLRPDAAAPAAPAAPAPQSRGVPAIDTKTGKTVLIDPVTRKVISQ